MITTLNSCTIIFYEMDDLKYAETTSTTMQTDKQTNDVVLIKLQQIVITSLSHTITQLQEIIAPTKEDMIIHEHLSFQTSSGEQKMI